MEIKDFIDKFLNEKIIIDNRHSTFVIALEDARKISGRDLRTGESKHHILTSLNGVLEPYSFIGVLNYLIILDVIGNVFRSGEKQIKPKGINAALYYFSDINEKDRFTLEALRNALAHSYSLVNVPRSDKYNDNSRHIFTLSAFSDNEIITYPETKWDGKFNTKSDDSSTIIQTNKLFDLVEKIVKNVRELQINNYTRT